MQLVVVPDRQTLAQEAAARFVAAAQEAIKVRGAFHVALSGGSTPRDLHLLLARDHANTIDWARVHVFWGDERCVPPTDERSNYRMAKETLLDAVAIPEANVHRPRAELDDREAAAAEYAATIRRAVPADADGVPRFDLILLGMGADGHTASLLPGSKLIEERARLVAPTDKEREGTIRLTVTRPLLEHAAALLFLVAGADKAEVLREVLEGVERPGEYPSQIVRHVRGDVTWLVDRAAAADLREDGDGR